MLKALKQKLPKINWQKIIERKQPLFVAASFIRPTGILLKEITGFGFSYQLDIYNCGTAAYHHSALELKKVDKYYLDLVNKDKEKCIGWQKLGIKYNQTADDLIVRFSRKVDFNEIHDQYDNILSECEQILLYTTNIPYLILSAIGAANGKQSRDVEKYRDITEMFELLRAKSRYPQIADTVFVNFWKAAAHLCKINDYLLFSFLTPYELGEIIKGNKKLNVSEMKKRKKWCAFYLDKNGQDVLFRYNPEFLKKVGIKKEKLTDVSLFKGSIACAGIVKGRVCIVKDKNDTKKFRKDDIVVSTSTNPSLMPILIKCAGIITDEGGIMCHAAIVSRELNKPCIIGTKIATKVLKDGDLVEVDADKGIIKILKK